MTSTLLTDLQLASKHLSELKPWEQELVMRLNEKIKPIEEWETKALFKIIMSLEATDNV